MYDIAFQYYPLFCNVVLADLKTVLSIHIHFHLHTLSQTFLAFGSCAGTSKELFESNLLAGVLNMWRRHYGKVLFGNIVNHIAELYDVGNDA